MKILQNFDGKMDSCFPKKVRIENASLVKIPTFYKTFQTKKSFFYQKSQNSSKLTEIILYAHSSLHSGQ